MFAPPVAKPQEKTAASLNIKAALQRSTAVRHRDGGIAAALALRPVPRGWAPPRERTEPPERETGPAAPAPRLPGPIQAKLKVGAVDDPLEHEADRVADQVMRMPAPEAALTSAPEKISRKCDSCKEEEKLQRKEAGPQAAAGTAPAIVHEALRSPGNPLDAATRAYFEPRFGRDFSDVRVHTGAAAEQSARDVNAHAYTVGHNVVFDAGRFEPGTQDGQRLIAHELTHVVQQSGSNRIHVEPSHEQRGRISTPVQIARAPKPAGDKPGIHPDAMAFLENKLRQFYELLSPGERIRLKRNSTIAIGMATVDREPRLVYTLANNVTSEEIRAAADKLDLHRWTYTTGVKGRGPVGALNDAEQLMTEFAIDNHVDMHGIAVSRQVCPDCEVAIPQYKRGQIQVSVIEDPIPVPRGPGKPPPGSSGAGKIGGAVEELETKVAGAEGAAAKSGAATTEARAAKESAASAEAKAARTLGSVAELGKIGALDAALFYLQIHAAHFAALEAVSNKAEIAKGLLNNVTEFENGARALRDAINKQQWAEAALPVATELLDTGEQSPLAYISVGELEYVDAYAISARNILSDAFHAQVKLIKIIEGWDAVVAQAMETDDFTRKSVVEAVGYLDLRFSKEKGGSFRRFLEEARDDAGRVEYFARLKRQVAKDILDSANLPLIRGLRSIHDEVTAIRTGLMAMGGGIESGVLVAIDELNIAQQATDFPGPTGYKDKHAETRFRLTVGAVNTSLSVLRGISRARSEAFSLRMIQGKLKELEQYLKKED